MPRHNNRKHNRNEGYLGFDPANYIGKSSAHSDYSRSAYGRSHHGGVDYPRIQRVSDRDYSDRHKAHSPTKKKRRAMNEIYRMQKTAERVWLTAQKRGLADLEGEVEHTSFPETQNSKESISPVRRLIELLMKPISLVSQATPVPYTTESAHE